MRILVLLALVPLLAFAQNATPPFRLPATVVPEHYRLDLSLDPTKPEYSGTVEIDLATSARLDVIWLNGKDLRIDSASLSGAGELPEIRPAMIPDEWIRLSLSRPLEPGRYRLSLDFHARFSEKNPVGAYRKTDGQRWYVYTAFTAIDARRAFPCFDQPEFKTPWQFTIRVPEGNLALANSRELRRARQPSGTWRFDFAETKPLATEVVAFAAGPFEVVEDGVAGRRRIPVRLIVPFGRRIEAGGISGATQAILNRLEDYTGIAYMWDKLDHLAVLDMPFGAIENPGLITYRDSVLLAQPDRDTPERRQLSRGTMAHELAHQWFGNLVTQQWWNDVWLSEGFATWLGTKIADQELAEPERGIAAVLSRQRILSNDKRPVRLDFHTRKEMDDVYGPVPYQKGGAILRMIEAWLGEEPFRGGLQRYLKTHAYSTATAADLAAALQAETGIDVRPVFASYLEQPGAPQLTVRIDCDAKQATVRQESKFTWNTPVCAGGRCAVISGNTGQFAIDSCPAWPDPAGAGFFRLAVENGSDYLKSVWPTLTAPEKLSLLANIESEPAAQLAILPAALRDREAHVSAAAYRMASKLALAPGADLEALRKLIR